MVYEICEHTDKQTDTLMEILRMHLYRGAVRDHAVPVLYTQPKIPVETKTGEGK